MLSLGRSWLDALTPGASYHVAVIASVFVAVYWVVTSVYSAKFHPLARFPGPWYTSISCLPYWYACITGKQVQWMHKLHSKYGSVVRYGVNELSYVDHGYSSWKAIHGHEKGGREFPKAKEWFVAPFNGIYGINSAPTHENHRRFRRIFAPAFSHRALTRQEPIFQKMTDLLLTTLDEAAALGQVVNMVEMYQFTTFDIMGKLTFGEPLGLLQSNIYTKWVEAVFDSIKVIPIAQIIQYYPVLDFLFRAIEPESVKKMKYNHFKHSADRVDRRLERGAQEPDIWSMILDQNSGEHLSIAEMHCHGDVFMLAGSETTGTALSGLTFYLLTHKEKMSLLVKEIRTSFANDEEINFRSVSGLPYLHACIKEALRMYPPVPVGVPRVVPNQASGQNMPGNPVPSGTRVSVHHYATYRSPDNFRDPNDFIPERWLGDALYEGDNRECFRPFAAGARDCLGQTMAMCEMQLIMARVLFRFNLEAYEDAEGLSRWSQQKAFVLWEKKPLKCRLVRSA